MSILRNMLGAFMPHFEARRTTGVLAAANAELVADVNGDETATFYINGTGTLSATYNIQGSPDGVNFYDLPCYPFPSASLGGTLPQPGQPLVTETVNAASVQRLICCAVGGLQKIRIRLTAYTSGSAAVTINTDTCQSISPYLRDQKAATLMVTVTGAAGAAATATLPAVPGLRHYIDSVKVTRFATAALTAAAAPVLVTTTNIPGTPVISFPAEAAAQGTVYQDGFDYGGAGMAATAVNTATTIVCPVATGVIWRVNVAYRLGL